MRLIKMTPTLKAYVSKIKIFCTLHANSVLVQTLGVVDAL